MKRLIYVLLCAIFIGGCSQEPQPTEQQGNLEAVTRIGEVVERIDVEAYSYLLIDEHGRLSWIATEPLWLEPGDYVEFTGGAVMQDFHSKELDRTFDYILFVGAVRPVDAAVAKERIAADLVAIGMADKQRDAQAKGQEEPVVLEPLEGGMTVAELFAAHGGEQGQIVRFRGRVVKVNTGILKRNWVTLADGTGTAPDDMIIATTQDVPTVGEVYTVEGTLLFDQYIGPGYTYKVLVTDGVFSE